MPPFRDQLVVLAPERDNFRGRIEATVASHAIAKQTCTVNDESGLKVSVRRFDDLNPIQPAQALDPNAGSHSSAV